MKNQTFEKKHRGILSFLRIPVGMLQRKISQRNSKGQTSLIMILILAMAFTFYAITLNWSKIANLKTSIWMAAVSASSSGASMFASYGERKIQEELLPLGDIDYNDGNLEHDENGFWVLIFKIFIVIIVAALTWYMGGWPAAILVAAMMTASLVIEYAVIRPMMFSMWNKLQQNLSQIDQYREGTLQSGIQQIVNDSVTVPDRFDLNANGVWGNNVVPQDQLGRFSIFYTERLKSIKPTDTSAIEAFQVALNNLITLPSEASLPFPPTTNSGLGFSPYCDSSHASSVQCRPQCTSVKNRSKGSSRQYVPDSCGDCTDPLTCPAFSGRVFRLLYEPSLEKPQTDAARINPRDARNSFRYRLGHDDEIGKSLNTDVTNSPITLGGNQEPGYNPSSFFTNPQGVNKVTGVVFPMLNEMNAIEQYNINAPVHVLGHLPGLSSQVLAQRPEFATFLAHGVTPLLNYRAANDACGQFQDSQQGFFWKKGADRYCSTLMSSYPNEVASLQARNVNFLPTSPGQAPNYRWPYYQCDYVFNGEATIECPDSSTKQLWPQDRMDNLVYQLGQFIELSSKIQKLKKNNLINSMDQWYQQMAAFIAPRCSGDHAYTDPVDIYVRDNLQHLMPYSTNPTMCNPGQQGYIIQWMYDMHNWAKLIDDPTNPDLARRGWLNQTYGNSAVALCADKTPEETVACLTPLSLYTAQLDSCADHFPAHTDGDPIFPPLNTECIQALLIYKGHPDGFFTQLQGVDLTLLNDHTTTWPTDATTYPKIKDWVFDNRILMDEVDANKKLIDSLVNNARASAVLFNEGASDFDEFMALGGPADALMKAVQDKRNLLKRLPSFVIYGWKDNKGPIGSTGNNNELWHLARIEVNQPEEIPSIQIHKHGFLGSSTRYTYTNGQGNVWVRASRWDEEFQAGTARFANNERIWRFRYGNPNFASSHTAGGELESKCIKNGTGIGLSAEYTTALQTTFPNTYNTGLDLTSASDPETRAYQTAFMLNVDPRGVDRLRAQETRMRTTHTPVGNCPAFDIDNCGTTTNYVACCGTAPAGYYGDAWPQYCPKVNLARCEALKEIHDKIVYLQSVQECFTTSNAILRTGVQASAGARFGVPRLQPGQSEKDYHVGIFFHSSAETKNSGAFIEGETYNDVSQL